MAEVLDEPRRTATLPVFPGKYVTITSYRRDGTAVPTPVWFVQRDGRLLVETDGASGKVKRIRRNRSVLVATCTGTGRLRGPLVPAAARVLPESEVSAVEPLLKRKYRADLVIIRPIRFLQSALHLGSPQTKPVILAIEPR
jgi:PPOX class probable F420-dependent enzyme